MSKHTPGPWYREARGMVTSDASGIDPFCSIAIAGGANREANARLISSAPELLEACKRVLESVPFASYRGDGELEELELFLHTAVAKAEGRE
jgi:hypothetical protein